MSRNCPQCGGPLENPGHAHRQVPLTSEYGLHGHVDEGIVELLDVCWAVGITTSGSCQGEPDSDSDEGRASIVFAPGGNAERFVGAATIEDLDDPATFQGLGWRMRGTGSPQDWTWQPGSFAWAVAFAAYFPPSDIAELTRPAQELALMARACLLRGPKCSDGGIAVPGKSRCQAHGGGAWSRTDPTSKHRYGADWRERRARVLRESPYCETCGQPATDVDHRVAVADGGSDDRSNLRALCNPCHKRHTAEQNRKRRHNDTTDERVRRLKMIEKTREDDKNRVAATAEREREAFEEFGNQIARDAGIQTETPEGEGGE